MSRANCDQLYFLAFARSGRALSFQQDPPMFKFPRLLAAAIAVTLLTAAPRAQTPAPQPPASQLSQQQINEEMLKELRQIRQLLERLTQPQPAAAPQPTTARITNLKGFVMGRPDAPLTMVEFTDLQCPFCRQYVSTTFDEIKKNW